MAALRERRLSQRGEFTYGDAADIDVRDCLARLRLDAAARADQEATLRELGDAVGRNVYARRMFEDSIRGAFIILSSSLAASHLGTLVVEDCFHRTARVRFHIADAAQGAQRQAMEAYLCGLLSGCMSEAFNCAASAHVVADGAFEVRLGEGRDVNRGRLS